ncbi:unnamed protein product, partial [Heterosigma akashiwo]
MLSEDCASAAEQLVELPRDPLFCMQRDFVEPLMTLDIRHESKEQTNFTTTLVYLGEIEAKLE